MKNVKYPVEAFALSMVLFSAGMQEAMLVGIALIFGDVLQYVLREYFGAQDTLRKLGGALTFAALSLVYGVAGLTPDWKQMAGFIAISVLLMERHAITANEELNYNAALLGDSIAYAGLILLGIVREFLSTGAVFNATLLEATALSSAIGKPMFALIGAGIALGVLNLLLNGETSAELIPLVCLSTILLETPFVWNNVPDVVGAAIGVAVTAVIYVTFRTKLVFSNTSNAMTGLPIELTMLGLIYMIVTVL